MEERELTIKDIWNIAWARKKMIIRNTLIVSIIVAGISLLFPNWYKGTAVILPPSSSNTFSMGNLGMLGEMGIGNLLGSSDNHNKILSILKSRSILEAVAKKYHFIERYDVENMYEAVEVLSGNIEVNLEEEMQISVSFWDKDQEMVAEITNYFIHCLDSLNLQLNTTRGKNNRIFIESRISDVLDSLKFLETQITQFMEEEGILSLSDQVRVGVENAASFKAEIMKKEIELAVAQNTFDAKSPVIKQLKNELNSLKAKYKEFFYEVPSDKLMPNFNEIPKVGIKFTRLERQIEYYVNLIQFLGPQYETARIEEAKNIPTIQILDEATRPDKKDKPRRSRWVLAVFGLTGLLCVYYAYFKDRATYIESLSSSSNKSS